MNTLILKAIASDYRDLNGTHIERLQGPPTSLEFSRVVNISRPVLYKGCFNSSTLPALCKWTDAYLCDAMAERAVSVAVTPDGLADALKRGFGDVADSGLTYFTEPYAASLTLPQLFNHFAQYKLRQNPAVSPAPPAARYAAQRGMSSNLTQQLQHPSPVLPDEVCYLQSQNGNLASGGEFEPLRGDVPVEITWATEALGRSPEAVNLWIGDSRSVTSVHSDPYENIYTLVRGRKHFTLVPPTESWCLEERQHPHATYTRPTPSSPLHLTPTNPPTTVSWATIDPTDAASLPPEVVPIHVTVEPGDALYLPAGWWHHVRQESDDGSGAVIALNWWYDMEMRGMAWVWLSHLRQRPLALGEDTDDQSDK